MNPENTENISPVKASERYIILDALRGIALLGIALANFPEFSLYTFQKSEALTSMPTAAVDRVIRYLQYLFIDGKFYTLFSLLFGIGFSIIISHALKKHTGGFRIFYRRMGILLVIGLLHLMFVWSGDILVLYAVSGSLLPLFRNVSNKALLIWSAVLILLPVGIDTVTVLSGIDPSAAVAKAQQSYCAMYGIDEENFGYWLRDAESYEKVRQFLVQGSFVRMREFIDGNRIFKVFGLFLLGFYIGRNRIYAGLSGHTALLEKVRLYGFSTGLPVSLLYAYDAMNGHPFGLVAHAVLYALGVVPLGLAYAASVSLWYSKHKKNLLFKLFAAPGRMALTNYIGHSVSGIFIFYGIGLGFGATTGLVHVVLIAAGVYVFQVIFSMIWLHFFRYGPLEWIWRMLTYGKWLRPIL